MKRLFKPMGLAAASLLLSGCVTAHFAEPVGKFTTAMATANDTIRVYFTEMNSFGDCILYKPT